MANLRTDFRTLLCSLPVVILLAGCAAQKPAAPLLLHPVPPAAEPYTLEQGALVFTGPGLTVSARPWDWRLVEEEIGRSGARSPFGDEPGDAGRFLFLRVRLENRSEKRLVFNPLQAGLRREGESPIPPLDNSDLLAFSGEDRDAEARARAFRGMSFDGQATLRPGESLERLLVFPAPEEAKLVTLALDEVWVGTQAYDLRFVFEAFPGK